MFFNKRSEENQEEAWKELSLLCLFFSWMLFGDCPSFFLSHVKFILESFSESVSLSVFLVSVCKVFFVFIFSVVFLLVSNVEKLLFVSFLYSFSTHYTRRNLQV